MWNRRISGGKAAEREKRLRPRKGAAFPLTLRAGNSAKIWTPPHLKLRRPHPPRLTDPPSLLLRWALPVPVAGFEERMISSLYNKTRTVNGDRMNAFAAETGRPLGKHSPAPSRERGVGVQQALAAEGATSTRPASSSSVKPTSFSPVLTQCARR